MCSGNGRCDTFLDQSFCTCDKGWMGRACETKCEHGNPQQTKDGLFVCICEKCYSGVTCEQECSGRGNCTGDVCDCGLKVGEVQLVMSKVVPEGDLIVPDMAPVSPP